MDKQQQSEFISQLTDAQNALRVHINLLLGGDEETAKDILQETNVWLWEHADSFDPTKASFLTWAKVQAYYRVLGFRRDAAREHRWLVFDQAAFETVAATLEAVPEDPPRPDDLLIALRHCLGILPEKDRMFVRAHYFSGKPFRELAMGMHTSIDAAKVRMCRLRKRLDDCITQRVCALGVDGGAK
jgi:RNA polymerase sigma factor (sigma-70 family)